MGMRKHRRDILRARAKKLGAKPSKFVSTQFHRIQVEKFGQIGRAINQAKGTHPRRNWRQRIADALM